MLLPGVEPDDADGDGGGDGDGGTPSKFGFATEAR